ncbi:hypothetical protein Sgleb_73470 [Streptomyces glebosus]|uniref:Uncharacterized protein n=1 Tax=Streptomyces glebosus TaxID=249580 RepID=A0A640T7Y2_9ACTN|nr:hypothetical protein Sgleb_73470 [Streptomyces glebosus]GHG79198.1 hypothetical protein GCM10010513_56350 [Streptomyces glebosus]
MRVPPPDEEPDGSGRRVSAARHQPSLELSTWAKPCPQQSPTTVWEDFEAPGARGGQVTRNLHDHLAAYAPSTQVPTCASPPTAAASKQALTAGSKTPKTPRSDCTGPLHQPRDLEALIDIVEYVKRPITGATGGRMNLINDSDRHMARMMCVMALKSSEDTARRVARQHLLRPHRTDSPKTASPTAGADRRAQRAARPGQGRHRRPDLPGLHPLGPGPPRGFLPWRPPPPAA